MGALKQLETNLKLTLPLRRTFFYVIFSVLARIIKIVYPHSLALFQQGLNQFQNNS
jgi:hypothetical protein